MNYKQPTTLIFEDTACVDPTLGKKENVGVGWIVQMAKGKHEVCFSQKDFCMNECDRMNICPARNERLQK